MRGHVGSWRDVDDGSSTQRMESDMSAWLLSLLLVGLVAYLLVALFRPEMFS